MHSNLNDSKHKLTKKRKKFYDDYGEDDGFLFSYVCKSVNFGEFMLNVRIMVIILILVAMTIIMMKLVVVNIYFLYIFLLKS